MLFLLTNIAEITSESDNTLYDVPIFHKKKEEMYVKGRKTCLRRNQNFSVKIRIFLQRNQNFFPDRLGALCLDYSKAPLCLLYFLAPAATRCGSYSNSVRPSFRPSVRHFILKTLHRISIKFGMMVYLDGIQT